MAKRSLESNAVDLPIDTVGQYNPWYAVICSVADGLPEVAVAERESNCLYLDKIANLAFEFDGEIAERTPDRLLTRDLFILVETEYLT